MACDVVEVCNSLSVVTYLQSNWYDNWATVFRHWQAAAVKRVLRRPGRVDQATAASGAEKRTNPLSLATKRNKGSLKKKVN